MRLRIARKIMKLSGLARPILPGQKQLRYRVPTLRNAARRTLGSCEQWRVAWLLYPLFSPKKAQA